MRDSLFGSAQGDGGGISARRRICRPREPLGGWASPGRSLWATGSHQGQEGVWPEVMLAEGPERTDLPGPRVGGAPSAGPPGLARPPPSWRHLLCTSWGPGIEQRHVPPPGGGLGLGAGWGVGRERCPQAGGGGCSPTEHHGPCGGPHSEEGGSEPRGSLVEETSGRVWGGRAAKLGGAGGIPSDLPQGSGGLRGLTDVGKHFAARLVQSQSPENKGS